jgi:hypothetical protein
MTVATPVRPADPLLRLRESENFGWKMFESFAEQLIAVFTGKQPKHFGKQGQKQHGIDAYVDLDEGVRHTFQFRQVESLSLAKAKKLVAETTFEGQKHYAFVACELDAAVREYEETLRDWEIWDIRDISMYVRLLPPETGRRLVYQFFGPDWVKNFFEGTIVASFISAKHALVTLGTGGLLRHDLPLVGRADEVTALRAFVESDASVALLFGRGGIGKTRLLAELPALAGDLPVFFATRINLGPTSIDDLPLTPVILVLDDAHERDDLAAALEVVRQRPSPTKLVLATRMHAVDEIRAQLSGAFARDAVHEIGPLEDLAAADTKTLIRSVVGDGAEDLVALVANRTADSPVLAVVASRLLRTKGLPPAALAGDADVRYVVFDRLRDEMLARVVELDQAAARQLIDILAAIGPIAVEAQATASAIGAFLHREPDEIIRLAGALEEAGILRRRGSRMRITPEVLADYVLERACLTKSGTPTGYATRLFDHFKTVAGARLLRNFAEIDWRTKKTAGNSQLLEAIWAELHGEFKAAGLLRRSDILSMVAAVAAYQPRQALALAEYAIQRPVEHVTDDEKAFTFGAELVTGHIPSILREIAYNPAYLGRAARLLWELGRDDDRPTHSLPGHPFRLLCELAGPRRAKPVAVRLAVVNAAREWLKDANVHEHVHSVLEVMQAALVRQGFDAWSDDARSFKTAAYTVNREGVSAVRAAALDIVRSCAASADARVVMAAVKVLIEEARPLTNGILGQEIKEEQDAEWKDDRLTALAHLASIAATIAEPLVALAVRGGIEYSARFDKDPDIHSAAHAVLAAIEARADVREVELLSDSWGHNRVVDAAGERDFKAERAQQAERLAAAAAALMARMTPERFAAYFNDIAGRAKRLGEKFQPGQLMWRIAQGDREYAIALLRYTFAHPNEPIAASARDLFLNIPRADAPAMAHEAIATENSAIAAAAAVTLSVETAWSGEEVELLRCLLRHADVNVRASTLSYLVTPWKANREVIFEALAKLEIGGSVEVAKAFAELFNEHAEPVASLSSDVLAATVAKLIDVPDFSDYALAEFLAEACVIVPEAVIDLFLARIERREQYTDARATAVPYDFAVDLTRLGAHAAYGSVLRRIRDVSADDEESPWRGFYLPQLWNALFDPSNAAARDILNEWFTSGDAKLIQRASKLLSQVGSEFVFAHREYVVGILTEAARVSIDAYNSVASALFLPGIQSKNGTHGQPFPEDIKLRKDAAASMEALVPHSAAWQFYDSLRKHADVEIERKRVRDEDLEEEYLD